MSRLGLVAVPLLVSSAAYAQAPGEVVPTAPPPAAPEPVVVNPCSGPAVMGHRISVGINFGGLSVAPPDDDAGEATFNTAEFAIRYRATPRLELELLLSGGRQTLEDDTLGDLAMGGGTLSARYRFRPGHRWDWWLSAGIGATVIERHQSTEEERDAAQRGHMAFGIGLERRWNRFAIHAEARMMALGQRSDATDMNTAPPLPVPEDGAPMPLPPPAPRDDVRTADELSAGTFTVGASFFF